MTKPKNFKTIPVLIVGAGQAGLSASYYLKQKNIDHIVLERYRFAHQWRENRWDTFCLVTPNWQCRLPDFPYQGNDPHGFMLKDEIVAYLEAFVKSFNPPLKEGVTVQNISRREDGKFIVLTDDENYIADQVIIASGGYDRPIIPPYANKTNPSIFQIQAGDYKNPGQLPEGNVLVVGAGQSGVQIMEDLYLEGRTVHLAVGPAPRSPRQYRGRDATDWLYDMGHYDITIKDHPQGEAVVEKTNHYLTGRDGGHEIDLRKFALKGVSLYGSLDYLDDFKADFKPDLGKNLDEADKSYLGIRQAIDDYIEKNNLDAPKEDAFKKVWHPEKEPETLDLKGENVTSIVWAIGFRPDYSWLDVDVLNERGRPVYDRGVCKVEGLYFLGLGWLNKWGSGRFLSVAEDADYIVNYIDQYHRGIKTKPVSKVS